MFLSMNFWVVDLILSGKNHLIEKKIDNSSNKMIVMCDQVLYRQPKLTNFISTFSANIFFFSEQKLLTSF